MLSLLLDVKFQEPENPKVHLHPFGDSRLGGSGLSAWLLLNLGFRRGQMSKVSLRRLAGGTMFPRAVSERLVGPAGLGVTAGCLADDTVRMLAAATRTSQAVIAMLGQLDTACGWQVAQQTGQHQREGTHEGPAGTAVGAGAGAGMVSAGALIILVGAMVEDALYEAHARAIVDQGLGRAQALLVADPAGGQRPRGRTFLALTLPTGLTQQEVLIQLWRSCWALEVQWLTVDRLGLEAHSPGRSLLSHGRWSHVVEQPLV